MATKKKDVHPGDVCTSGVIFLTCILNMIHGNVSVVATQIFFKIFTDLPWEDDPIW